MNAVAGGPTQKGLRLPRGGEGGGLVQLAQVVVPYRRQCFTVLLHCEASFHIVAALKCT